MYPVVNVVKKGDTLSEIALHFYGEGTQPYWQRIYEANKAVIGNNPNLIKPGEVLKIPFPPVIPPNHKYTVKPGDTLSEIALHFYGEGTEPYWKKIYDANKAVIGADPDLIKPGQQLTVPPGEHEITITMAPPQTRQRPDEPFDVDALPTHDLGPWPEELSLRRADLYDEDGR